VLACSFEEAVAIQATQGFPRLRQVVLDGTDARLLAEFYRQLLGWRYLAFASGFRPSGRR
jgi:hypothetical protein